MRDYTIVLSTFFSNMQNLLPCISEAGISNLHEVFFFVQSE